MPSDRRQYSILLLAWIGWVFDIADTALFTFAKGPMLIQMMGVAEYKRNGTVVESTIQEIFLLGWSLGGLIFSVLADRWGRTRTLVLTVFLYCACTGLTALCRTPEQVMAARFFTALGIGGEWAAGAVLVAEAFADAKRPFAASLLQTAAAVGPLLAALANLVLAGSPWQWMFLVGILPAALCVIARTGTHDPVKVVSDQASPIRQMLRDPLYRRRALAAMMVGAVGIAGAGTASYWQPNLVRAVSAGFSPSALAARTSTVTMVSQLGTLAGVLLAPYLCRVFGRKKTILGFFLLTPPALLLALGGSGAYERLILFLPLVNFVAIGVSGAFVLYFPELFPLRFRATGAGIAYNVGRIFSIPVPHLTGWAAQRSGGSIASGVLLTGSIYVIGVIALAFLPETRDQSLEETCALSDENP